MSLPQNLGRLSAALTSDASLNIGVGVTPSGSFKLEVGTTSKFTGVATFGSTLSNGTYSYTLPGATGTLALVGGAGVGTVTSVAAITLGTTGTDLSSTVATGTTTPVITLQVPTASATNRGALSSADWSTFNGKQGTITLTTTGTSGAATFVSNTLNIPNYGSALSSYLPLSGGTLTGALSGTSATLSGKLAFSANSGATASGQIGRDATYGMFQWASTGSTDDWTVFSPSLGYIMHVPTGTVNLAIASLSGTGSRAVLADASGVLSAPVSDISVKQNIKPIGYGLNEIVKMNPVWFDFVDEYKNFGEGRQNGNIAQEMSEIIPEAVFVTPSTGKMGINYDQLHAVYIKAIQELKKEIDILKNK